MSDTLAAEELRNQALTETFNRAWSARDCAGLLDCLHDDVVYMVYEGGPVFRGPKQIERRVGPFMAKFSRIEFEILRMHCIGPAVIHERTERYYGPENELDTFFQVVGVLVMQAGRIVLWRDYAIPGVRQVVGPLCLHKENSLRNNALTRWVEKFL